MINFNVKIDYVQGKDNFIADYLSRETFNDVKDLSDVFPILQHSFDLPYNIKKFINYYDSEETLKYDGKAIITVRNKEKFYVPGILRDELLRRYHAHPLLGSHFGFKKNSEKFQQIF